MKEKEQRPSQISMGMKYGTRYMGNFIILLY